MRVRPGRRGPLGLLSIAAVLAIVTGAVGQRSTEPRRHDIVARFTSGVVQLRLGSEVGTTHVTDGRVSVSTDDPRCAGTFDEPCVYTINEVRLVAGDPFTMAGMTFEGVLVGTTGPGFNQIQTFLGATSVRSLPFWVIGTVDGQPFAFFGAENPASYLSVGDLQMGPDTSSAVLFGNLEGTLNGQPGEIRFSSTADTPFENRPPYLDPVPPGVLSTACVAELDLDPGLRDVDGDVTATWAEIGGFGIGGTPGDPALLPIGRHTVTMAAEDRWGALGRESVVIDVVSDGTIATPSGTEIVTFELPRGAVGADLALLARNEIDLSPNVTVVAGTAGGRVASLGRLALSTSASTGEAWAAGNASLGNRSRIRGRLHVGGTLAARASAVVEGGVARDGPYTPYEVIRFAVPTAASGTDVRLHPGETATLASGAHGAATVASRARLVLGDGPHTFRSLSVAPDAELVVSGDATAPTVVRVEGAFSWNGAVTSTSGPGLLLYLATTGSVSIQSRFDGWILAPSAEVTLHPAASPHRGAVFARAIRTLPGVLVEHVAPDSWIRPEVVDACAVTPVVTCVRDNSDGSMTAVFGYTSLLRHMAVVVPRGPINRLHPALEPSTDHQSFAPVGDASAFEVRFTDRVRWILGTRTVVASAESVRCP